MYINIWNLDTRIDSRFRLYWSPNQLLCMYSCWFSNSIVFAMINCEKMALFAVFFIAMVYENYKFFDTYVCGLYNVIR